MKNRLKLLLFTATLGLFTGIVVWLFLKAVSELTALVWEKLPALAGTQIVLLPICAAGGIIAGLLHKFYGNYPEELSVVMRKVKKDKHYEYHPMLIMLISALIPLVIGASVGPEAGLTGIIAALCYWIGDNVSFAKQNSESFSEIGEAVTLGQLFHSPLFGIFAVEESDDETQAVPMQKGYKLLLYGLSAAAAFLSMGVLNRIFGKVMEGFPSFSEVSLERNDYILLIVYIFAGSLLYILYEKCEKLIGAVAQKVPVIAKETICGIVVGVVGMFFPVVLFSGEEQMAALMVNYESYTPLILLVVCLVKIIMTAFCLKFGLKGGHFFPLIFAGTCMGYAIALLVFRDAVGVHGAFAAGAVTATLLGAQLKKPFAAALLLLLCFPVRMLLWLFLCAAAGNALFGLLEKNAAKR